MKSLTRFAFVLIGLTIVISGHPVIREESVPAQAVATNDLVEELTDEQFLGKISAEMADHKTCEHFANEAAPQTEEVESAKASVQGKQVTVSALVQRALNDQRQLLAARQSDLERWSRADQHHFAKWFGTTSEAAREKIYERIRVLTLLNQEYSVGNFRKAVPSKPGLFAFVHSNDPSKIFVDQAFIFGSFLGENSRAGTICHEMSHFTLAGGTKDVTYGVSNCRRLARLSPERALNNADNFEFYMEGVR